MDTNLALVLLLSPFIGFLFNVFFGKKIGKTFSGTIGTLSVVVSFAVSGATTLAANDDNSLLASHGAGNSFFMSSAFVLTGLTGGTNTFTLNYRALGGSADFLRRSIIVQGIA